LLDGDYLFDPFQGALKYGAYWDDLPEMIIVGINQSKSREDDSKSNAESGLPEEKGEKFFEFIGELVTAMQKQYRIAPFKIIAGHDVTAGFLNYYLYKDDPLFTAYISMSPELPKDMEVHVPERLAAMNQLLFYYHSTSDGDVKKMQKRIRTLDENAKKVSKPMLNYKFDDFKGASHYSLVLHSIPNALYQFFSVYQPISSTEFNEKIATLPSGYVDYLVNKYDVVGKARGWEIPIPSNDFKAIEAAILKNKAYTEFDKLADLAKKNYPKSMLSDYHLGMMYEKTGEYKKAAKAYQSGFQKEEIGDLTKDLMLEKADEVKQM
jgi:predicted alpha/beta superfamily hydrolase